MKIICIFLFLLAAVNLFGQSGRVLRGTVVYLNSGKQPAAGVLVSATSQAGGRATPVYSNAQGAFQLEFPNAAAGDLVSLHIGDALQDGQRIELVNPEEVQHYRIPDAGDPQAFHVVVCAQGARNEAALGYYRIIKHSSTLALETKKQAFSQLLRAQDKDYDAIAQLSKDIEQLYEHMDSLTWYKQALHLASINRDDASDRTLEYLRRIEAGETVQAAREVLDVAAATAQLETGLAQSWSAIEELDLRARASEAVFDYKDAVACYERVIGVLERAEVVDELLLGEYYRKISNSLIKDGQYQNALKYESLNLDLLEKAVIDTSASHSYNNLSNIYSKIGNSKQALLYSQKSMSLWKNHMNSPNYGLAIALNNMAMANYYADNLNEAWTFHKKALKVGEIVYDSLNPSISILYHNASLILGAEGKYTQSLSFQKKSLAVLHSNIDSLHPQLASCYQNMALAYENLGNNNQALFFIKKALSIYEKSLDPIHPDLASAYKAASRILFNLSYYERSLFFHDKSFHIYSKVFNEKHPQIATGYGNMAIIYINMGNIKKALANEKKSLSIKKCIFHANSVKLARSYRNLARIYSDLGKFQEAISLNSKALEIYKKKFHYKNPIIFDTYEGLATNYGNIGNTEKGLQLLEKIITIYQNTDHFKTRSHEIYSKISLLYYRRGRLKKCIFYHNKALEVYKKNNDSTSLSLAACYSYAASAYSRLSNNQKALSLHQKALDIRRSILDSLHPALAESYNNLGILNEKLNNYIKSLELHYKALSIWKKTFDSTHFQVATSYNNIAHVNFVLGNHLQSIFFFEKAINILEKTLPPSHPNLLTSYSNIITCYIKAKFFIKAKKTLLKYKKSSNENAEFFMLSAVYFLAQRKIAKGVLNFKKYSNEKDPVSAYHQMTSKSFDAVRNHPKFKRLLKQLETKLAKEQAQQPKE